MLLLLLLLETLIHRLTRHLPVEVPTVGDVVAACLRLALRLIVIVVAADALLIVRARHDGPAEWEPHARAVRLAAISAFAAYVLWRFLNYRMDSYIADNPLPSADSAAAMPTTTRRPAASRLRTLMPLLRATGGRRSSWWSAACWCCRISASTSRR